MYFLSAEPFPDFFYTVYPLTIGERARYIFTHDLISMLLKNLNAISYEFELLFMNLRNSGKTGRGCFIYFSIKMKALKRCPPSHPVPNIVSDSGACGLNSMILFSF